MSQCPGSYGYVVGWVRGWHECSYCGQPVRVTPKGVIFKHRAGTKEVEG